MADICSSWQNTQCLDACFDDENYDFGVDDMRQPRDAWFYPVTGFYDVGLDRYRNCRRGFPI